jgi:hypothetical protein
MKDKTLTIGYIRAVRDIEYLQRLIITEMSEYNWIDENISYTIGDYNTYRLLSPLKLLESGVTQEQLDSLIEYVLREINKTLEEPEE